MLGQCCITSMVYTIVIYHGIYPGSIYHGIYHDGIYLRFAMYHGIYTGIYHSSFNGIYYDIYHGIRHGVYHDLTDTYHKTLPRLPVHCSHLSGLLRPTECYSYCILSPGTPQRTLHNGVACVLMSISHAGLQTGAITSCMLRPVRMLRPVLCCGIVATEVLGRWEKKRKKEYRGARP
jgi:hypothetical protein